MKHFTTAIHPAFSVGQTDPRLFGSFVEHMGSVVYNGIFQPGHPCANEKGWRMDGTRRRTCRRKRRDRRADALRPAGRTQLAGRAEHHRPAGRGGSRVGRCDADRTGRAVFADHGDGHGQLSNILYERPGCRWHRLAFGASFLHSFLSCGVNCLLTHGSFFQRHLPKSLRCNACCAGFWKPFP